MKNVTKLGTLAACFLIAGNLEAKDAVDPGQADNTWVVGIGAGITSNPYANEEHDGVIIPRIRYNGDRFFFNEKGIGLNVWGRNEWSGGLLLRSDMSFLHDAKDFRGNTKLAGLDERDAALEAGFYLNYTNALGRLRFTALNDVSNVHKGQSAELEYILDLQYGDWHINPYAGINWISADKADHHVGVRANEVTANRAEYKANSSLSLNAGVSGRYSVNQHWDFTFNTGYSRLGSGVTDSPIIEDKNVYYGTVGVNYNF